MKLKIAALAAALGLAAIPAMAYPTAGSPDTTGNTGGNTYGSGTMNSQAGTMNTQNGNRQIQHVKLSELPQQVQTTINEHLQGGTVRHISQVTANGQTFYVVTLKNSNGQPQAFRVDATGQYLGPQTQNLKETTPGNENNMNTTPQSGNLRPSQQER